MIICPNCKNKELEGALFCSECGAKLIEYDRLATQSLSRISTSSLSMAYTVPPTAPLVGVQNDVDIILSLHFVDTGAMMHLSGRKEYVLGRVADGQTSRPDVDLSPHDAYGQGVSRQHASLKVGPGQHVTITDLGSSNGTRVNGQKTAPQTEYPLKHGDLIALGKLKIQLLIRK